MEEELKKRDDYLKKLQARTFLRSYITGVYVFITIILCSCSHKVYVPVESVRTDTLYLSHRDSVHVKDSVIMYHVVHTRDSVAIHDSVVIVRNEQGEVKERLIVRYRDRWHATQDNLSLQRQLDRYRLENDSLREANSEVHDTIVPVKEPISKWMKWLMAMGVLGLIGFIWVIVRRIYGLIK